MCIRDSITGETYKYYVTEVGINQNNSMSGYDVSYVFKNTDGTVINRTDANVAPGKNMACLLYTSRCV